MNKPSKQGADPGSFDARARLPDDFFPLGGVDAPERSELFRGAAGRFDALAQPLLTEFLQRDGLGRFLVQTKQNLCRRASRGEQGEP